MAKKKRFSIAAVILDNSLIYLMMIVSRIRTVYDVERVSDFDSEASK